MWYWLNADHSTTPVSLPELEARGGAQFATPVAKTVVGESKVSTVFLPLDHQWRAGEPPLVFETLVFGGPLDEHMERCTTWAEAEAQHEAVVDQVRRAQEQS